MSKQKLLVIIEGTVEEAEQALKNRNITAEYIDFFKTDDVLNQRFHVRASPENETLLDKWFKSDYSLVHWG